jgi:hypothetical protein
VAAAHPDKRIELWFEDECRVGAKGRTGHRWWLRGERPRGLRQQGYEWAHLFGAVHPATGAGFALALPEVSTAAMQVFLDCFAATLAPDVQGALVLDGAGWHGARDLVVPSNISLIPLPPYAPELNPVERVWLYLEGMLALPSPAGELRRDPRGLLRGLEHPHPGAHPIPHRLFLDREGRFLGAAVLQHFHTYKNPAVQSRLASGERCPLNYRLAVFHRGYC